MKQKQFFSEFTQISIRRPTEGTSSTKAHIVHVQQRVLLGRFNRLKCIRRLIECHKAVTGTEKGENK